jgi:3',5'-cyclic AMP phosphodiesterase CpdA
MKFLHVSDIHLCDPPLFPPLRVKRTLGWLNWIFNRRFRHEYSYLELFLERVEEEKPDFLIVSGDLVQLGTKRELVKIMDYLERLEEHCGKILYTPGNHDRFTRDKDAENIVNQICRKYGGDSTTIPQFVRHESIEFILVNQSHPTRPFHSGGRIVESNWRTLEKFASAKRLENSSQPERIVIGHFPIYNSQGNDLGGIKRMQEFERFRLLLMSLNCKYYLCGHVHYPFSYSLSDNCKQLCAGSLTINGNYWKIEKTDIGLNETLLKL